MKIVITIAVALMAACGSDPDFGPACEAHCTREQCNGNVDDLDYCISTSCPRLLATCSDEQVDLVLECGDGRLCRPYGCICEPPSAPWTDACIEAQTCTNP